MRSWVAACSVIEICPVSPTVLRQVISHRAVAPTLYLQPAPSREVFRYKYPESGDALIPNDFWDAVPAPSHRTVFPSPILQSTAVTFAVAVTVNPDTLASR